MRTTAIVATFLFAGALAQAAPRTWHFTCDYNSLDMRGHLTGRQRYTASYTRGLAGNTVRWSDAAVANGNGWSETFAPAQKQDFMEGFSYPYADAFNTGKPDFFHGFPASAIQMRNMIWDAHMLEGFVKDFDKLTLNVPYHVPGSGDDMELAGAGTFKNHDLQLILTGTSKRNGKECALIDYRAMFNTLDTKMPGVELVGRSDFWGQIWLSLDTKQIEYATLFEEVIGELTLNTQPKPMNISVVRVGTFEPVE